ncbi:uncharacterized protein LOC100198893 isoform X1 [Hydra vulgaris]|uniref:uncharacterized protein LOC100198893 isoform X1 n=1 Tax=Hydra vulgaris TaxID=6087 RepID=UPI0002B43BF6|nr:uncharacterized protein LOC100198893 isoform X1 [Hydra vulgaris]
MRSTAVFALVCLFYCITIRAKPIDLDDKVDDTKEDLDEYSNEDKKTDVETKTTEKKDEVEKKDDESEDTTPSKEESKDIEDKNADDSASESDDKDTEKEAAEETSQQEVEENDTVDQDAKKDEVPEEEEENENSKVETKEDVDDIIDDKPETGAEDIKGNKRELEDLHHDEHEGEHHHGEHMGHDDEHGHHKQDHHEHDHHHHDHGYEFYEEWGEHGGHEGEHHGDDEGEHHGDHEHDHHHHHKSDHGGQRDIVPSNIEQFGNKIAMFKQPHTRANKKWWMVGDHWEGWGHDAWDKPHIHHEEGGWQYDNNGLDEDNKDSHHKRHIKKRISKNRKAAKRCGDLDHDHNDHKHVECAKCGYQFHECGCNQHDEDHDLRGCWAFGYDKFGDDWDDWDHNEKNFEHLKHLEHEKDEKKHECNYRRSCVKLIPRLVYAFPGFPMNIPNSANPRPFVYPSGISPQYGYGVVPFTQPLNSQGFYRLCHDCSWLPNGGTRCLCKSMNSEPNLYNRLPDQVFLDCDSSIHRYPQPNCIARHVVPIPTIETSSGAEAKQGIVYPYVGYGPWSAYPWWGDWWGGHGNHGWGKNEGLGQNYHHSHHNSGIHLTEPSHLGAFHCRDVVANGKVKDSARSKRFCLPIGYQNYNYPYWHGYPGVGTGLWGWGWPWIKNKIPGSLKNKSNPNKLKTQKSKKTTEKKDRKNTIPDIPIDRKNKITKKQTIHVGYGYASGDNYRLGYGIGGMGGVAGFSSNPALYHNGFTRSKIPGDKIKDNANKKVTKASIPTSENPAENSNLKTTKTDIPTPENTKEITASKRNLQNTPLIAQKSNEIKNTIPKPLDKI